MSAIAHAIATQTAAQSTSSSIYTDITGASIASGSFTAGKKYLLLITAQIGNSTTISNNSIRTVHGSTAFAESEMIHNRVNPRRGCYGFMTVWAAVSGEGIKLQMAASAGTVVVDQITMVAINLSDDVTENTDWFYNERVTDDALSTTFLDGAAITLIPATAGHNWLVISYAQIDAGDINDLISRLERSGEAASTTPEARGLPTSTAPIWPFLFSRVFNLGNASNTFKERAATGGGTAHVRLHSAIFAINLNKFRNRASAYTEADVAIGTTAWGTQLQSIGITPDVASDVIMGAYWGWDKAAAGRLANWRTQLDNVDEPATQTTDVYAFNAGNGTGDEDPMFLVTAPTGVTAAAHTIDLDADADVADGTGQHASLWAFTTELAPVAATAKELAAVSRGLARGLGRGAR